jgi:hypothetical protein
MSWNRTDSDIGLHMTSIPKAKIGSYKVRRVQGLPYATNKRLNKRKTLCRTETGYWRGTENRTRIIF